MGEGEAISVGGGVGVGELRGRWGGGEVDSGGGVNNYGYETWRGGREDLARFVSFFGLFLESTEPGHDEMLIHIHTHNTAYSLGLHDCEASRAAVKCRRTYMQERRKASAAQRRLHGRSTGSCDVHATPRIPVAFADDVWWAVTHTALALVTRRP